MEQELEYRYYKWETTIRQTIGPNFYFFNKAAAVTTTNEISQLRIVRGNEESQCMMMLVRPSDCGNSTSGT